MSKNTTRRSGSKQILSVFFLLLILGAGAFAYHHYHTAKTVVAISHPKTITSSAASAPAQTSVPNTTNTTQQGGVVDTNGKTPTSLPNASLWTTSSSGKITLQQPTNATTVASGDTISGLAQVNNVQFILTDSSVGLIAQGNLNVVDGKFSGILNFTPHSSSGTLELYYPNPDNGAEEDIVNINVNFND